MESEHRGKPADSALAPLMVSVDEAHRALAIGRTQLYAEIKAGRIQPLKFGKRTLIPVAELHAWPSRIRALAKG